MSASNSMDPQDATDINQQRQAHPKSAAKGLLHQYAVRESNVGYETPRYISPGPASPTLSRDKTLVYISHKTAEKGRRNRINSALAEMEALLPQKIGSSADNESEHVIKGHGDSAVAPSDSRRSKASVIEDAVAYIKSLQNELQLRKTQPDDEPARDKLKSRLNTHDQSGQLEEDTSTLTTSTESSKGLERLHITSRRPSRPHPALADGSRGSERHTTTKPRYESDFPFELNTLDTLDQAFSAEPHTNQVEDSAELDKKIESVPIPKSPADRAIQERPWEYSGPRILSTSPRYAILICYGAARATEAVLYAGSVSRRVKEVLLTALRGIVHDFCLLQESLNETALEEAKLRMPGMFNMILDLLVDFAETLIAGFDPVHSPWVGGVEDVQAAYTFSEIAFNILSDILREITAKMNRDAGPSWNDLFPESLPDDQELQDTVSTSLPNMTIGEVISSLQHTTKLLMNFIPSLENLMAPVSMREVSPTASHSVPLLSSTSEPPLQSATDEDAAPLDG